MKNNLRKENLIRKLLSNLNNFNNNVEGLK
jgi:hypothetical protein